MKLVVTLAFVMICIFNGIAQKQTFDIASYTPPKGWKKESSDNVVGYTFINDSKKNWCRIGIYKSTGSKGSVEADFESEWDVLIKKEQNVTEGPQKEKVQEAGNWKILAGAGKATFGGSDMLVLLTTFSGYNTCISMVAMTNSADYLKQVEDFAGSIELKKPDADNTIHPPSAENNNNATIIGTWTKSGSVNPDYYDAYTTSIAGYTKDQYTFYSNGSYHFISKTFRMSFDKILLVKEKGTYQVSGTTITINPLTSVIEAWSKKDGVDQWGKLLSTQKRTAEKTTYQFTKHYFSGIQQWNLVLQAGSPTKRDGPFSGNTTFSNAYYYAAPSNNNTPIELPPVQK